MPEQVIIKKCPKCNLIKDISDFYNCKSSKDGHQRLCKKCNTETNTAYSKTEKGKISAKKRKRRHRQTQKYHTTETKYHQTDTYKKYKHRKTKRYRRKYPDKRLAATAIRNAISRGKMPSASEFSCIYCGDKASQYHHHNGYDKEHRLDVIPVCCKCHKHIHC